MQKAIIISPKCTSKSAKYLATELGCAYNNPYENYVDTKQYDTIINWGVSQPIEYKHILNHYDAISKAVNKEVTLSLLKDKTKTVEFTKDIGIALQWIKEGNIVVGRKTLKGNRSKGIIFLHTEEELLGDSFKLFTKYINIYGEFRINVFGGKVVTMQEKKIDKVNNFNFITLSGVPTKELKQIVKVVDAQLGLDYYGIDLIVDHDYNMYILEVNSAPTLSGKTADVFVKNFKKEIKL